jgi:enamine deaminase RidA (YjgF/YER057c/UK114 family)
MTVVKRNMHFGVILMIIGMTIEAQAQGNIEKKLQTMGITLYELPAPTASYVRAVRSGNLVFLSGHGPMKPDGSNVTGKLGQDLSVEEGQQAARYTAIALLSALREEIGDLDQVQRIVKVHGMVNATPDFTDHSLVMNGFSDLMAEVFGDAGKHARAAVGMASLPGNIAIEIEMVVEVKN